MGGRGGKVSTGVPRTRHPPSPPPPGLSPRRCFSRGGRERPDHPGLRPAGRGQRGTEEEGTAAPRTLLPPSPVLDAARPQRHRCGSRGAPQAAQPGSPVALGPTSPHLPFQGPRPPQSLHSLTWTSTAPGWTRAGAAATLGTGGGPSSTHATGHALGHAPAPERPHLCRSVGPRACALRARVWGRVCGRLTHMCVQDCACGCVYVCIVYRCIYACMGVYACVHL